MKSLLIGIIREGKKPPDRRVAFTPAQIHALTKQYPDLGIQVQSSPWRSFADEEYKSLGIPVVEDVSSCDILMGIKEVPPEQLISAKTYFFFSHTLKKQSPNKELLQTVLARGIRLIDYEVLRDRQENRLVAFGKFAGIVGAYNALLFYGEREKSYQMRRAFQCKQYDDVIEELKKVRLPPVKFVVTGGGRVAGGAMQVLDAARIQRVAPEELNGTFPHPVYAQLRSKDYHVRRDNAGFDEGFYDHPELYSCTFLRIAKQTDILIAGAYWNPKAPPLFTLDEMRQPDFRIRFIADISCDINGPIPSTVRPTTVDDPVYDFDPVTGKPVPAFSSKASVTVMAIDNLPCELPREASQEFGHDLSEKIIPLIMGKDPGDVLGRATIAHEGRLTETFSYLQDYVT